MRIKHLDAFITVHLEDTTLTKKSLTLKYVSNYINSYLGSVEQTLHATNGYYTFRLRNIEGAVRFLILSQESPTFFLIDGYIEPGDNIIVDFIGSELKERNARDFRISGKGSTKLLAKMILNYTFPNNLIRNAVGGALTMKYLDTLSSIADSNYVYYQRILNSYKNRISSNIFKTMDADIYGRANLSTLSFLAEFYNLHPQSNPRFKDSILMYLPKLQNKVFKGYSPFALKSDDYLQYLYSIARESSRIKNNSNRVQDVYEEIISNNSGLIREKLLIYFLTKGHTGYKGNDFDFVLSDALKYLKNPDYRKLAIQRGREMTIGSKAYPFSMPDSTGKKHKLNDFAGKTIIIDCWFTGCGSCTALAEIIDQEVLPKYIKNDDVVFISVSTDKSANTWKNSIKSGKYTNIKSVNLFTEGLGLNHPFIKNYNFQGFPQLMLIDKNGKIYSPALPRQSKEMIEVIDQALKIN